MKDPLVGIERIALMMCLGMALSACNMTSAMTVPKVAMQDVIFIEQPTHQQASFALSKVVANIRRGTVIGHFPAGGVEGVDGTLCNYSHRGESTFEWSSGTSTLGNWSTELGEVFFQSLSQSGLNIAGNPSDLFGQQKKAGSAEYLIGARITKIASNICQEHDAWYGLPQNSFSGEMFIDVEWTIFSSIQQQEIIKFTTQGYHVQKEPKSDGVVLLLHDAFAHATEGMLANKQFIELAKREYTEPTEIEVAGYQALPLHTEPLSNREIKSRMSSILSAVATIRIGSGHGSGFFVTKDGYLLTNAHVVGHAQQVAVILNNGIELVGEVLRRSEVRDIALVKVNLRVPHPLAIRVRPVERLEQVFAVGTPIDESLQSTVTSGVVSGFRTEGDRPLIQADVAISPGNSGGPLIDEYGNVVGISVSKIVAQGSDNLGFFIPISDGLESIKLVNNVTGS